MAKTTHTTTDIKIENIKLIHLNEARYNPRKITERELSVLRDSIRKYGVIDPIIVNRVAETRYVIVGGHQRVRVCRSLKMTEVPCVVLNLSEQDERELNVRLNQNGGRFDMDILANEYEVADLLEWGFTEESLDISVDVMTDEKRPDNKLKKCRDIAEEYALWMFNESRKKANGERKTHPNFDEWMNVQQ